jgi:ubiquinone/menaquinone biosynthesis C-methylase UbiE
MLLPGERQTMGVADASLQRARGDQSVIDRRAEDVYLETLGVSDEEKRQLIELHGSGTAPIDPVVMVIIAATSGLAYKHLIGKRTLTEYPIPTIRLPQGKGELLLDIGCNWGRWSVAAARKGYSTIGIDPSLGAVMAARRVARHLVLDIRYLCGDGRNLPFASNTFDRVYSYSVLQHFSKSDATRTLKEIARTLKSGGRARIQMANKLGIRGLQHQAMRGFKKPERFDVRYYTLWELRRMFEDTIGATRTFTDCYFGLGWQMSDYKHMAGKHKAILLASETLRQVSDLIPPMRVVADSLFCDAVKEC